MKIVERVVLVILFLVITGGGIGIYLAVKHHQQQVREAVARGEYEIPISEEKTISEENWRVIYPYTTPILIGSSTFKASVADTLPTRIKGLSGTPFLPDDVVKLFVFGTEGKHSIWMKDMKYPLDIMWVTKNGEIVYIEENISPDTYPQAFSPNEPVWYVIEANAGFVENNQIKVGNQVTIK